MRNIIILTCTGVNSLLSDRVSKTFDETEKQKLNLRRHLGEKDSCEIGREGEEGGEGGGRGGRGEDELCCNFDTKSATVNQRQ